MKWHCVGTDLEPSSEITIEDAALSMVANSAILASWSTDDIVAVMAELGRRVPFLPISKSIEGSSYVSMWLRKDNLKRCYESAMGSPCPLDGWVDKGTNKVLAQPRGLVCHWVASNVPTLGMFSWALASMAKNPSLVKVSERQAEFLVALLKELAKTEVVLGDKVLKGRDLAACVSVVTFEGADQRLSSSLSQVADVKVVWGGQAALAAITALPQREWCETILFGPKYSFTIFSSDVVGAPDVGDRLRKAITDALLFDQMACSSPHTFFFECEEDLFLRIVDLGESILRSTQGRLLSTRHGEDQCARIINARGHHLLSLEKDVRSSKGLEWTLLVDRTPDLGLADPVGGRCLIFRRITPGHLDRLPMSMTRKVQAAVLEMDDPAERLSFSAALSRNGVDRVTRAGQIHEFALPWDGTMILDRMVRYVSLR